jgi:hypothetical protein
LTPLKSTHSAGINGPLFVDLNKPAVKLSGNRTRRNRIVRKLCEGFLRGSRTTLDRIQILAGQKIPEVLRHLHSCRGPGVKRRVFQPRKKSPIGREPLSIVFLGGTCFACVNHLRPNSEVAAAGQPSRPGSKTWVRSSQDSRGPAKPEMNPTGGKRKNKHKCNPS